MLDSSKYLDALDSINTSSSRPNCLVVRSHQWHCHRLVEMFKSHPRLESFDPVTQGCHVIIDHLPIPSIFAGERLEPWLGEPAGPVDVTLFSNGPKSCLGLK